MPSSLGQEKKRKDISFSSVNPSLNSTSCIADPFVHHGRHFGRTIHALCRVHAVLNNGILRESSILEDEEELATER